MPTPPRPVPTILAELAEVQRHLVDAPPHHGSGIRAALHEQARRLEAELARARATATGDPSHGGGSPNPR